MAHQAQDTFIGELPDGTPVRVERGQVFADNHPVVKLDAGRGLLFKQLDMDAPPKRGRGRPRKDTSAAAADAGDGSGENGGEE